MTNWHVFFDLEKLIEPIFWSWNIPYMYICITRGVIRRWSDWPRFRYVFLTLSNKMYGDECERLNGTEFLESGVDTFVFLVARAYLICREIKNYTLPTPDMAAGSIWPPSGILFFPLPPPFGAGPKRRRRLFDRHHRSVRSQT